MVTLNFDIDWKSNVGEYLSLDSNVDDLRRFGVYHSTLLVC